MQLSTKQIQDFLEKVDTSFPVAISQRQNLKEFAVKLNKLATICAEIVDESVVSMVAGYTENLSNNMAYISIVATKEDARGKGIAKKLISEFIDIAKNKGIEAVHLYTEANNTAALHMYKQIGFDPFKIPNEPRSNDVHLILYLKNWRSAK